MPASAALRSGNGRVTLTRLDERMTAHEELDNGRHANVMKALEGVAKSNGGLVDMLSELLEDRRIQHEREDAAKAQKAETDLAIKAEEERKSKRLMRLITIAGVVVPLIVMIADHVWK